ncbi:MAG: hypothetical protein ACP5ID_06840 [Conexivisphaera sp.]
MQVALVFGDRRVASVDVPPHLAQKLAELVKEMVARKEEVTVHVDVESRRVRIEGVEVPPELMPYVASLFSSLAL